MSKKIYFGLAQWRHSQWYSNQSSSSFELYCNSFSTVEGNSSFYALPSESSLRMWQSLSPEGFKFCFKFPKEISHKLNLSHCSRQVGEFLNRISVLNQKLGVIWLQLDKYCGGENLAKIVQFFESLPKEFDYGIEVRHPDFYRKNDLEKQFNRFLIKKSINRVMFDTRSLFAQRNLMTFDEAGSEIDSATLKAFGAKPEVPTHVIATGRYPFVRIIVPMDRSLGRIVINQWIKKIDQWLCDGLIPFVFFHTPDNAEAPLLALEFSQALSVLHPGIEAISLWDNGFKCESHQGDLF